MYRAPKKRKSYSQKIDFEISKKTCSFIPSTKKYRNMGPSTMSITFIVLFPEARRYVGRYVPTASVLWLYGPSERGYAVTDVDDRYLRTYLLHLPREK